ncbi:MAG: hypothetical protein WDA00_02900 [Eubacteriales bacterium]
MKKIACLFCCLLLALALSACGQELPDAPEGMQLASDPARHGYSLYLPEDWHFSYGGGVWHAYASAVDPTALTVSLIYPDAEDLSAYWADSQAGFRQYFEGYEVLSEPAAAQVGGRAAFQVSYRGRYREADYGFIQYFVLPGTPASQSTPPPTDPSQTDLSQGLLVFTYQAKTAAEGESLYDRHLPELTAVVGNFAFAGALPPPTPDVANTGAAAPEGMKLACDPLLTRYYLYVPADWTVALSSGAVSAYAPLHAAAVTAQEVEPSADSVLDYWETLREQYERYYQNLTVVHETLSAEQVESVDDRPAYRYEFTGEKDGVLYRVRQYIIVKRTGLYSGVYLLTYSAREDGDPSPFEEYLPDAEQIKQEFTFR